jgi:hypothetical protein
MVVSPRPVHIPTTLAQNCFFMAVLDNSTLPSVILAVLGAIAFKLILNRVRQAAPLPPGPKGLPLLGNALDMPKSRKWLTFTKWGEQYGPFISLCHFFDPHQPFDGSLAVLQAILYT